MLFLAGGKNTIMTQYNQSCLRHDVPSCICDDPPHEDAHFELKNHQGQLKVNMFYYQQLSLK
jgi:hypothetical protein